MNPFMLPWPRCRLAGLLAFALIGCGGGGGTLAPAPVTPTAPTVSAQADISLLFFGNSHTAANGLPAMVQEMVRAARPGLAVASTEGPGWMFLDERSTDAASLALLRSRRWNAVVLQAQKYSSSGLYTYSTEGAEALVREARGVGALPVMFPEWPRLGIDETQRIYDLHVSIATREPACVAPVGQAWDLTMKRYPGLALHATDGNHAAPAGSFLAALMIFGTYARTAPDALPFLPAVNVDAETQARLRAVATDTLLAHPARQWCPADS